MESPESDHGQPRPLPHALESYHQDLQRVLESAAKLQQLIPDAVVVGGTAAALYANHRASRDHDHVIRDLGARFEPILDDLDQLDQWRSSRTVPGKIILGSLGDIEAGIRQLIREVPLETETYSVKGQRLEVPTFDETLRIKMYLALHRNQTRDYIDIAALADARGIEHAARVIARMDDYYASDAARGSVASQAFRQLAECKPKDVRTTETLDSYKGLDARWHDFETVRSVCRRIAVQGVLEEG